MTQTIKWKLLIMFAAVLLSVYFLVPSLFDFNGKIEKAKSEGREAPAYTQLFPKKGVNLGLDLRGGLYVELNVDLNEAIKNRLGILSMQVERSFENDAQLKDVKLNVADNNREVMVAIPSANRSAFMDKLRNDFGDVFEMSPSTTADSLFLQLSQVYIDHLREMTLKQALEAV